MGETSNHTIDERVCDIAARQHGVFTRRDAVEAGATDSVLRHRLDTKQWIKVHPRVYRLAGAPTTWRQPVCAATLAAGGGAAASTWSAAALRELPGYRAGRPTVTVLRHRGAELERVHVRETLLLPEHHRSVVDEIRTTTVARTIFDLCGIVRPERAPRTLDDALARRLVTIPSCWRVLDELAEHGRSGTVLMRSMLMERSGDYVAPASVLERKLLQLLREHGLPEPEREIDLGDRDGWVGRVEVVYRDASILIEADSRRHHSSFSDQIADRRRDNQFMAEGYRVLRFTWDDLDQRPSWVANTVARARQTAARGVSAARPVA